MRFVGYVRQGKAMGNVLRIQMDQHQQIIGTEECFDLTQHQIFIWEKITDTILVRSKHVARCHSNGSGGVE